MPQNLQRKAALPRHKAGAPEGMSLSVGDDDFLVVGIGASAGGLDACRKLIAALPEPCGMSFILIQHLDPSHESMMVDLLKGYTSMAVIQAADGMPIERERLYVIAPGTYLSVVDRRLRVSLPEARHGARLPFDFLLRSLAKDFGARAVAVILSGTGADGSVGLKALEESGGFIVAQEPKEAGYAGMPSSAIDTCLVDLVLPASEIAEALAARATRAVSKEPPTNTDSSGHARDPLADVIDLLREKTVHDFTSYKTGTLQRRPAHRHERNRSSRQGPADQCHPIFPRSRGIRSPGGDHHSRSRRQPAAGSGAARLGRRMQHGGGGLFARHSVPRGDRFDQA